jgi:hypothetical protein
VQRNSILDKLQNYQAEFPVERETVAQMVDFIAGHEDCFERSLSVGHITGSAWLMDADFERA